MRIPSTKWLLIIITWLLVSGCHRGEKRYDSSSSTDVSVPITPLAATTAPGALPSTKERATHNWYGWLSDGHELGAPGEFLRDRIAPPKPLLRDPEEVDSLAEWLRFLPLFPKGAKVRNALGEELAKGDDSSVAAVIQMVVPKNCRENSVGIAYRLHAEWLWNQGERKLSFRTATDEQLPFVLWARGERPTLSGRKVIFSKGIPAPIPIEHSELRDYLNGILPFLDVGAVLKHSRALSPGEVRAGDVFLHVAAPEELVVVLDTASYPKAGKRAFLLGRAFQPCSSLCVAQASKQSPWFFVDGKTPIAVAGLKPFEWSEARRLRTYGYSATP